ncbi:10578_t:CDS:2 [Acaulospora morrowiae]|uniref:10578_t:CDS:1 n=1 Tax=Acaulospora morrowiae TaxID=94023 RepID=A0A9N9CZD1_9GLOM|nr:10578_t:CDS:2 [Acaulospora morrowiae]
MAGSSSGKRSRTGEQYFEEFRTHFWERPETHFDQIQNVNTSSRRREERWRNRIPPPTYEEVSSMLNMSHRESPAGQRDRSASPTRRTPSRRDETINRDNASNLGRDLAQMKIQIIMRPIIIRTDYYPIYLHHKMVVMLIWPKQEIVNL